MGRLATLSLVVMLLASLAVAGERSERREEGSRTITQHTRHHKPVTSVPEPGSLLLLGTGLLAGWAGLKRLHV